MSDSIKSKKSKTKKHMSIKQQNKKVFRSTDPLLSVFIWGINYSCNELRHVSMPKILMPDDFTAYIKVKIDNQHFNKDILPSHYKVKEYCPIVFKNIREKFGINDDSFMKSFTGGLGSTDCNSGKSNAKFYLSFDKKYMLKTVASEDVEGLHNILSEYHKHIVVTNGNTLLPHLLCMYRLTVEDKENYVIVMRNVFQTRYKIHMKYDLKGSTVDRTASQKEKEKDSPTFKDNDLISDRRFVAIGPDARKQFMERLTIDVNFLTSLNLMDYSLLVGIHDMDKEAEDRSAAGGVATGESDNENFSPEDTEDTDDDALNATHTPPDSPTSRSPYGIFGIPSAPNSEKREIYFMALIDILTHYGLKKKSANVAKTVKYNSEEISTVKPEQYARRFLEFIKRIIVD